MLLLRLFKAVLYHGMDWRKEGSAWMVGLFHITYAILFHRLGLGYFSVAVLEKRDCKVMAHANIHIFMFFSFLEAS